MLLQFLLLRLQLAPIERMILRAREPLGFRNEAPQPDDAAASPRPDHPNDLRAFRIDGRHQRGQAGLGRCGGDRFALRLRLANLDPMPAQLVNRAANLTPQRAGRVRFHLDQQLAGARIVYLAERVGDCDIAHLGLSAQLAKLGDSFRNRRGRIESRFVQARRVEVESFFRIGHVYVPG